MSRSPFAYPMSRSVDGDAGGAADLQTDVMRFMAILALCLMAIFALVQSIPLAPVRSAEPEAAPVTAQPNPRVPDAAAAERTPTRAEQPETTQNVALTRPKWVTTFEPSTEKRDPVMDESPTAPAAAVNEPVPEVMPAPVADEVPEPVEPEAGFTLRFESDRALMRLVAARQVGFYAIDPNRSQRMTVSNSRISFWDASTPNSFHEMERATVPAPVIDALARTGADAASVSWGVTLPGALRSELDDLMRSRQGGALVIGADGTLRLEPNQ